jgi:hypothetical protein
MDYLNGAVACSPEVPSSLGFLIITFVVAFGMLYIVNKRKA